MSFDDVGAASDILVRHWQAGLKIKSLPQPFRPITRSDGYSIQSRLERLTTDRLFGWKVAATSAAGQKHLRVDGPLAGRLVREMIYDDGATLAVGSNGMRVAEAEFAFRMSSDLTPRRRPYDMDEVMASVSALHLAIEVPDSRFHDFSVVGAPQLIADNACGHQLVLGPPALDGWRDLELAAHKVVGYVDGHVRREGLGANVLGDPRNALVWLANELSGEGLTLAADQIVTTGTCLEPIELDGGRTISFDYGVLGNICARFEP